MDAKLGFRDPSLVPLSPCVCTEPPAGCRKGVQKLIHFIQGNCASSKIAMTIITEYIAFIHSIPAPVTFSESSRSAAPCCLSLKHRLYLSNACDCPWSVIISRRWRHRQLNKSHFAVPLTASWCAVAVEALSPPAWLVISCKMRSIPCLHVCRWCRSDVTMDIF